MSGPKLLDQPRICAGFNAIWMAVRAGEPGAAATHDQADWEYPEQRPRGTARYALARLVPTGLARPASTGGD